MEQSRTRSFIDRWAWLCPFVMILAAAAVLVAFGFTVRSALLAALLLVCPVLIIWGAVSIWRRFT